MTIRTLLSTLAVAAVFTLSISSSVPYGDTSAYGQNLTPVTVRLAFNYNGHRSPYLLGQDKGFYAEEGLDVKVLEGRGVTSSMQLVANKQDTFAIVDPPSLMLGASQGMELRQVVQLYQVSPNALISWKDANIDEPADLVGKTISTLQGDTTTTMLYALLARNGIDASGIDIVAADGGTRNQTFLAKRSEAITGFTNDSYIGMLHTTEGQVVHFPYSQFGINTMGDGVAAHIDTITEQPEVVRGFVRATLRAYEYALEHPEEAIQSLVKVSPNAIPEVEVEKLKATAPLMTSEDTEAHGIGYSAKERWEEAQELMLEFGGLSDAAEDVSVYYTNEFLPDR